MVYDAVIIGAGPSGAHLSCLLARSGMRVALVDQCAFPRDKLCGGMLTYKTLKALKALSGYYPKGSLLRADVKRAHVFYEDSPALSLRLLSSTKVVRRYKFDTELVRTSESLGTQTYYGSALSVIDFKAKEVYLRNGSALRYARLIGADGARSRVRRLAGLPHSELGFCMEVHLPWEAIKDTSRLQEGGIEIYYGKYAAGYAWAFPSPDSVAVGVGSLTNEISESDILGFFHAFLNQIAISTGVRPHGAYIPSGHGVTLGSSSHDVLLIGDAAGLIDPFTGEGIYYALMSAEAAASAVLSGQDVYGEYVRRMRPAVESIREAVPIRNRLYAPAALESAISTLRSCPQYCEQLIDEVILRGQKGYLQAYEELAWLAR